MTDLFLVGGFNVPLWKSQWEGLSFFYEKKHVWIEKKFFFWEVPISKQAPHSFQVAIANELSNVAPSIPETFETGASENPVLESFETMPWEKPWTPGLVNIQKAIENGDL